MSRACGRLLPLRSGASSAPRTASPHAPPCRRAHARLPPRAAASADDILPFERAAGAPGPVLALGKFDALHRGHRALALAAAGDGAPALLSFDGIAAVLGWEPRLPVVAPCDRGRVLAQWSRALPPGTPPLVEHSLPFAAIRTLSPADFVALLRRLGASGVVAGHNYRFGFRASGDAAALQALCGEAGLSARIVDMVTAAEAAEMAAGGQGAPAAQGSAAPQQAGPACALQVSSTGVRAALAAGDVATAAALLGRRHRVVLDAAAGDAGRDALASGALLMPPAAARNQPPREGRAYDAEAALQLRDAAGAVLWAAGGDGDGAAAASTPPLRAQLEPLPGGSLRVALLDAADAAAARRALAGAPPGARLRVALDLL